MRLLMIAVLVIGGTSAFGQETPQALPIEKVAQLRQAVDANPDDVAARAQLASHYAAQKQAQPFVAQIIWLIENHPESEATQLSRFMLDVPGGWTTEADYARVQAAWENALAGASVTPNVEYNAAFFFQTKDPQRALELLTAARNQDRMNNRYLQQEAGMYTAGIDRGDWGPSLAQTFQNSLLASSDPDLLRAVGNMLLADNDSSRHPQPCGKGCVPPDPGLELLGRQLLQRAATLQPANTSGQGPYRLGGQVMEANLIRKVQPVYPPLAVSARVQGVVEFTATIDETGKVVNLQLVRGHPLLVAAARDAVYRWLYRPTLLNGQPVSVIADITVPFTLPR
jgi:protein TonB